MENLGNKTKQKEKISQNPLICLVTDVLSPNYMKTRWPGANQVNLLFADFPSMIGQENKVFYLSVSSLYVVVSTFVNFAF